MIPSNHLTVIERLFSGFSITKTKPYNPLSNSITRLPKWYTFCVCVCVFFFTDGKGIVLSVSLLLILEKNHRVTKVVFSGGAVNPSVIIKHWHLASYMYRTYRCAIITTIPRKKDTQENCSKTVKYKDFNLKRVFFL